MQVTIIITISELLIIIVSREQLYLCFNAVLTILLFAYSACDIQLPSLHDCAYNISNAWSVNPLPAELWERAPYWGCARPVKGTKKKNRNFKL